MFKILCSKIHIFSMRICAQEYHPIWNQEERNIR